MVLALLVPMAMALPSFEAFKAGHQPSDAQLFSREGTVIASQRANLQIRRGAWVPLAEISPTLAQAVVVAEDKRFAEHSGVDWQAAGAALWSNLQGKGSTRGASSISMQLASLLDHDAVRSGQRSVAEKASQTAQALWLEQRWSKAQILEAYLNRVDFRGDLRGVGAASAALFGKSPHGLNKTDAATLAALLRGPNAAPGTVAQRACGILRHTRPGVACDAASIATSLQRRPAAQNFATNTDPAGAIVLTAAAQSIRSKAAPGTQLPSSLSAPIQAAAMAALREQVLALNQQGVSDAAAVVLHNRSGEVLAYVGSAGALAGAAHVDAAAARRQAGSTLKPLLYARLMDRGLLNAATVLEDSPLAVATQAGSYIPRNYNERHIGPVSVRKALAASLNIPAVRAIQLGGVEDFASQLQANGISLLQPAEVIGEALALGAADVRLIDLTNAYRTLANGGLHSAPRFAASAPPAESRRVLSAQSAWVIGDILSDNAARASTFGFDSVLATPFWTAVKTGTSKDMRDNWAIGYSQHYTVGVWVGRADGKPMAHVSGVSGAAPAWAQIMRSLHGAQAVFAHAAQSKASPAPDGLQQVAVKFEATRSASGETPAQFEPSRMEWLPSQAVAHLAPGQPLQVRLAPAPSQPKILEPLPQTQIAWDPDIPSHTAKLSLRHSGDASSGVRWQVNGQQVKGDQIAIAALKPGRNQIALHTATGQRLDEVQVEFRGKPSLPLR